MGGRFLKKLIAKTVIYTLISFILAVALLFGALTLFSPKTIGAFFDGVGATDSAVDFYEQQYKKTGSLDDLVFLVNKIGDNDSQKSEQYLYLLINRVDFKSYCDNVDSLSGRDFSSSEYYTGEYVLSLAKNFKFDLALETASDFVNENGYTINNPFRVIIWELSGVLQTGDLVKIKDKISLISPDSAEETAYLNQDKEQLTTLLG